MDGNTIRRQIKSVILIPSQTIKKAYDWTIRWSKTKYAKVALFFLALSESSFFPIPPDVLLIAMTVADRYKWWIFALITTTGSVIGGIVGYYIGYTVYESVGKSIVDLYHLDKYFEFVQIRYEQNAFLAVFTAAFTPIPYKVFTIAGGLFQIPLPSLILGSILGRGGRFFIVALMIRIFGKKISDTLERYFDIFSLLFMALLIGGFILLKYL
ncbi:DedA family protein [Candidatus Parcubacteria bacterium]|nr:MAG: DedA family protein [Candidatus Parcubacteria bacterium]